VVDVVDEDVDKDGMEWGTPLPVAVVFGGVFWVGAMSRGQFRTGIFRKNGFGEGQFYE